MIKFMKIEVALTEIAREFRLLGEKQKDWERDQINWQKGRPPFDDFCYYVALSAVWQTFSKQIEGEQRKNFVLDLYEVFNQVIEGRNFDLITKVLKKYRASRYIAGVNLFLLWSGVIKQLKEVNADLSNPLLIQKTAEQLSSRTQHWLVYAPLEAAIVVGELFPALPQIVPPLGKRVMKGLERLGLYFGYPPTKRELEVIHRFLLYLAKVADTNHLIIEMGIWAMAREDVG